MSATRLFVALCFWLVSASTSWAQMGLLTTGLAGWTGHQFLERAEQMIANATEHARQVGDALLARSVTEADMLVHSIRLQLGSEIDKAIGELNNQTNLAYYRLAEVLDSFETAQTRAYSARDATVIDLATVAGTIPFVGALTFVERIEGLVQFDDGGDFTMKVAGTGLKPGIAGRTAVVRLKIDGNAVQFVREQPLGQNIRQIVIPHDALQEYFEEGRIVILPAELTLAVTRSPWYSVRGVFDRTDTVEVPIFLSLFPKKAGTMTIEITRNRFKWESQGEQRFDVALSINCHNIKGCHYVAEKRCSVEGGDQEIVGNRRIVGTPRHYCHPRDADWTCSYPDGWFKVLSPQIQANGRVATLIIDHWTGRNEYGIICEIEEYKQIESVVETKSVDMYYDRNFEFVVPANTSYWRIRGSTLTRRSIEVLKNQPNDSLNFIATYDEGQGRERVAYAVNRPAIGFF